MRHWEETLIATVYNERDVAIIESAPKLLIAAEDGFTLLRRISDMLHYENGLPVTALEACEIKSSTVMQSPSWSGSKRSADKRGGKYDRQRNPRPPRHGSPCGNTSNQSAKIFGNKVEPNPIRQPEHILTLSRAIPAPLFGLRIGRSRMAAGKKLPPYRLGNGYTRRQLHRFKVRS
jgi:hypothetical protein